MAMHNPLYIKVENALFQKRRKLPSNLPISYCNAVPFFFKLQVNDGKRENIVSRFYKLSKTHINN